MADQSTASQGSSCTARRYNVAQYEPEHPLMGMAARIAAAECHSGSVAFVQVEATRWVAEDSFPRVLECRLTDVDGDAHHLIDKEPVFSAGAVTVPGRLDIACSIGRVDGDRVTVTLDHGVMTASNRSTFVVSRTLVTFDP
jgi:hypothetical protein